MAYASAEWAKFRNLLILYVHKKRKPTCSTKILSMKSFVKSKSTRILTKCPNGLSKTDLLEAESIHIGVPILLAIANKIRGLQHSWDSPCILIQTWAHVCFIVEGTKSLVHGNSFRTPWGMLQAPTNLTLWTSSREEKANSKSPFPRHVMPYFPIDGHNSISLPHKIVTDSRVDPFTQMILLWRWCLQASTTSLYTSSGMKMANLSPLRQGVRNWLVGMSHTLCDTTAAKYFAWFCALIFLLKDSLA